MDIQRVLRWQTETFVVVIVRLYNTDASPHGQPVSPPVANGGPVLIVVRLCDIEASPHGQLARPEVADTSSRLGSWRMEVIVLIVVRLWDTDAPLHDESARP